MRISTPAGAIMAAGLLGCSSAQATYYGALGSGPNGVPVDSNGNVPPFNPNDGTGNPAIPGTVPGGISGGLPPIPGGVVPGGTVPGTVPGTIPNGVPPVIPPIGGIPDASSLLVPGGLPSNVPFSVPGVPGVPGVSVVPGASISGSPNCPTQTSTVVVTVYPTNPHGSQGGLPGSSQDGTPNSNSIPHGPGSEIAVPQAPIPTQPPSFSNTLASSAVSFFTTLTIDIWGSPGDGTNFDDGSGSGNNDAGSTGGDSSGINTANSPGFSDNSAGPLFPSATASETVPEYSSVSPKSLTTGWPNGFSDGPGQQQSSFPFQSQPPQPGYPGNAPGMPSMGTGTDQGQQPNTWPAQSGNQIPAGSQAPTGTSPWFTVAPGDIGNGPFTNSLATTATADGLFTAPSGIPQGEGRTLGYPSGTFLPGNDQGPPQGFSTGISLPAPVVTGTPTDSVPQGPSDGSNSQSAFNGFTTCAKFTITGADGLPSIVDSTWVIPAGTPISQAPTQPTGVGISEGADGPFATDAPGTDSRNSGVTTCTSYTIIGPDGLPSVVHSTWVVPNPTPFGNPSSLTASIQTGYPIPGPPGNIQTGNIGGLTSGAPGSLSTGVPSGEVGGIPGGIPTITIGGAPGNVLTGSGSGFPITTCVSYTVTGSDGLPTIVDSTWVIPGPVNTMVSIPESSDIPFGASTALTTGIPPEFTSQAGAVPGLPSSAFGSNVPQIPGVTTYTSYTVLGTDGLPTVVSSTWVIPGPVGTQTVSPVNPSFVSPGLTSDLPAGLPSQITGSPVISYPSDTGVAIGITTCATYTVIGPDGLPTVFDSTWVLPTASYVPTETGVNAPLSLPQVTSTSDSEAGQFTVVSTALIFGSDGQLTPVVSTVIVSAESGGAISTGIPEGIVSGIPAPPPSGPLAPSGDTGSLVTEFPSLTEYNDAFMPSIMTGSDGGAQNTFISSITTGTVTSTVISTINPNSGPLPSDGAVASGPLSIPGQAYGPIPTAVTLRPQAPILQTSTWTNLILAPTTTYTLRFPLTTMATVTVPGGSELGKRVIRRVISPNPAFPSWKNSSSASLIDMPTISLEPSKTSTQTGPATIEPETKLPIMCATGGNIGNMTIDFDSAKVGPLFNPVEEVWFSEGFHIAPPSSRQIPPFIPTSGGRLVEFVPISSSNITTTASVDIAEIGMGPHAPNPCFRFNFFGANLGCETKSDEEWCEFEISAYRYNDSLSGEESIAWTQTKRVAACSTFLEGGYELTPIELDGYADLSSVLIIARVGSELRSWWGDDFRVGWTDSSCVAASCRSNAPTVRVKRETIASALRRGIWRWTPSGLERFDDEMVWDSVN